MAPEEVMLEYASSGPGLYLLNHARELADAAFGVEAYRAESAGERMVPVFLDMIGARRRWRVLDAGCGTGRGMVALTRAGFSEVAGCDITPAGILPDIQLHWPFTMANLWDDRAMQSLGPVDHVYCCDVLEHIPEPLTMLAVRNMLAIARQGVFVTVSTGPDTHGVWVGEPLHQTVNPFTWWRKHLGAVGDMLQARDLLDHGVYLVQSRRGER